MRRAPSSPPPAGSLSLAGIRLNKALAQAGVSSRRGADELIRSGKVTVNGQPADLGTQVHPGRDDIRVDGKPIGSPAPDTDLYYVLNKPVETVTTVKDPEGRRTVVDILGEEALRRRIFPVGRLDYFSEGLLILTTDGELANRLMHPRWHLPKLYWVTIRGEVPEEALAAMRAGMKLAEGERLAPVKARIVNKNDRSSVLEMELIQGVNRQIRRMCRDLGLTILKLVRISQGPLKLGKLPVGKYRPLQPEEVQALKAAVDLR